MPLTRIVIHSGIDSYPLNFRKLTHLIGGDLNCTLTREEVWARGKKHDPLAGLINGAFLHHNMIDVYPQIMGRTWDNGRTRNSYLAKRLDRFLLNDKLMDHMGRQISNIVHCFTSDHRPISLQWGKRKFRKGFPFKFNKVWLEDAKFNDLVKKSWSSCLPMENSSPSQALLDNLRALKVKVKSW